MHIVKVLVKFWQKGVISKLLSIKRAFNFFERRCASGFCLRLYSLDCDKMIFH